jgi:hypothetical protein
MDKIALYGPAIPASNAEALLRRAALGRAIAAAVDAHPKVTNVT